MTKTQDKPGTLSFEEALGELETLVRDLESGKAPLEESIAAYERGMFLRQVCEQKLKEAQLKVEQITLSADGAATGTVAFAADSTRTPKT